MIGRNVLNADGAARNNALERPAAAGREGDPAMEWWACAWLVLSAFALPFSLPAARACVAVSTVLLLWHHLRLRRRADLPAVAGWAALFTIAVVWSTVHGVHPELGLPKLRKFFWLAVLPVSAVLVNSPARAKRVLGAFAAGAGVLAVKTCILLPYMGWRDAAAGKFPDFWTGVLMNGSMTDAQRLMAGILVCIAFVVADGRTGREGRVWRVLLALQAVALLLTFKRGSWACTVVVAGVYVAAHTSWKRALLMGCGILALSLLPPVRARIVAAGDELRTGRGGRMTMWTRIAPRLVREYPWFGIGYRSLTSRMMLRIDRHVERGRDHLHSNIAQVLVETGIVGFTLYALWVARALADALRLHRLARAGPADTRACAAALLLVLIALLANGLVEYNFGDAEIVLIYGLVMGCAAGGLTWARRPPAWQTSSGECGCPA